MIARPLLAALIGATIGAAAVAQNEPTLGSPGSDLRLRGESGLLCSLARYLVVAGVGRRCLSGQDAPFQAAIAEAIARLDARAQASSAMSRAELDAFARAMSGDDRSNEAVCDEEGLGIYRSARDGGLEPIRLDVERQLARPGPPEWGLCL